MVVPGLINLDFNDVRTVMNEMGKAMMGTGQASGENRAIEAARQAISNPLLDDVSLRGAKGLLINITGGSDLTLHEVNAAANMINDQVDDDANIIVGSALDSELDGQIRVSVVATGVDSAKFTKKIPESRAEPEARDAAPVLELGVHERAEEEARAAYETYFKNEDQGEIKMAVNGPPPFPAGSADMPEMKAPPLATPIQPAPAAKTKAINPVLSSMAAPRQKKKTLGLWGRRKAKNTQPPAAEHSLKSNPQLVANNSDHTGDLFGDGDESELDIPAFLRR